MRDLRQELRFAWRGLRRTPAFTATAVLTLALGIAGTTLMFALIEGVLLRPLPVHEQERLVVAWKDIPSTGFAHMPFEAAELRAVAEASEVLESVAGYEYHGAWDMVAVENGNASHVATLPVTGDFFQVVGVEPALGRTLLPSDDVAGAERTLVISDGLWKTRYGGSRTVVGRRLTLRDADFTIVGVMPPGFEFPRATEAWVTVAAVNSTIADARFRPLLDMVGRLRPGATAAQAHAELAGMASSLEALRGPAAPGGQRIAVRSLLDVVAGDVRQALVILFGCVGLVLLIASANVANLLLIRGAGRRTELAVRAALGAGRGRVARQLLAESLVLALLAGSAALAFTAWGLDGVIALIPEGLPRIDAVGVNALVVLFAILASLLTAVLAGVAPALAIARTDLIGSLRAGGRGVSGGARHGRRALVVAQVALAVVIVAAAGLLTRSLLRLQSVDLGFAAERIALVQLGLPRDYEGARLTPLFDDLLARLEAAPGIEAATTVNVLPFSGMGGWDLLTFSIEGQPAERAASNPTLNMEVVRPNYFRTLGIPILRGRGFTPADRGDAAPVVIVTEDLAAAGWPGEDPIGKRIKLGRLDGDEPWRTVVGIAARSRYRELERARTTIYFPISQFTGGSTVIAVRTRAEPALVAGTVREVVRTADPDLRVVRVAPFSELMREPLARPRFNALLIAAFGAAALVLAAVGIYGLMSAWVRQRYVEIGIRVALGASAADVKRLVLREGLRLALIGAALGLAGAFLGARVLRGLVYGIGAADAPSMLAAAALLVGVAAFACWLPARRAARVDPMRTLRSD